MSLIFVDCEGVDIVNQRIKEFGAVAHHSRHTFHGKDDSPGTFLEFSNWLIEECKSSRPVFVSDNPAYDWQGINCLFLKYLRHNPFGHSARRIGDFYAGLVGDWSKTQEWKRLRRTNHDHNPVNDAMGNCEAFDRLMAGER